MRERKLHFPTIECTVLIESKKIKNLHLLHLERVRKAEGRAKDLGILGRGVS